MIQRVFPNSSYVGTCTRRPGMAAARLLFRTKNSACIQAAPSAFKTTQEGTNMDVSDSSIKNSDSEHGCEEIWRRVRETWFPATFGDFWSVKSHSPPKSVDHKTHHSFLGVMNKITRRLSPWTSKPSFILSIDSFTFIKNIIEMSNSVVIKKRG